MNAFFLESTRRYLATHSEIRMTVSCGAVIAVLAVALVIARELARSRARGRGTARIALRRYDVAFLPALVLTLVVVVERFRLLA